MNWKIHTGDCLDVLRTMPDASVDAVITDPPYGLAFMGKRWDYDVPSVEAWAECLRVLKPGGHLLAFFGTRTYHRGVVRVEDAGFEIRDCIAWVYGQGFPKSLDVSKAIDKMHGAEREVVGQYASFRPNKHADTKYNGNLHTNGAITAPSTPEAARWSGWGTALKPAMEPIVVARKPLCTCATNVLQMVESQLRERGVRGEILWKPESASGAVKSKKTTSSGSTRPSERSATFAKTADESVTRSAEQQSLKSSEQLGTSGLNQTQGVSESFQGCTTSDCANRSSLPMEGSAPAAESVSATFSPLTTSTAEEPSTASKFMGRCTPNCAETDSHPDTESFAGIATGLTGYMETVRINRDSEGFFLWPRGLPEFVPGSPLTVAENVLRWGTGAVNVDGCRVGSDQIKTRIATRENGGGQAFGQGGVGKSVAGGTHVGRWPANLIHDGGEEVVSTFPEPQWVPGNDDEPGYWHAPAARFFYCAKASKGERGSGNNHPTVKPVALMAYLCRLVTPPGGVVLDPFTGSGSTGVACVREGFDFIGIEREAEYVKIAEARIQNATKENG